MPIVGLPTRLLNERLGDPPVETEQLVELLQRLGCDVEGYDRTLQYRCRRCRSVLESSFGGEPPATCDGCGLGFEGAKDSLEPLGEVELVRIDLLPVRPDMLDPGGLARALRTFTGRVESPAIYECAPPTLSVEVDPAMSDRASYRPHIACCVLRGVSFDEELIRVVMKLQENLHWAMGRDRKLASIGVYDLETITGPSLRYRPVEPGEIRFVPLMCDPNDPESNMTPREILERHPKGTAYAHLLSKHERYPLLEDAQGGVLSMPPIINSEATRVSEATSDLFIDVTGLSDRLVHRTLAVAATSLVELMPDQVVLEQVTIVEGEKRTATPDLAPDTMTLSSEKTARLLGAGFDGEKTAELLRRMGHTVHNDGKGDLSVKVPAYRNDVMHEIDLVEDVAIAHGFDNFDHDLVRTLTVGQPRPVEELSNLARRALTGLGLLEVATLPLTSPEASYDQLGLERSNDFVAIANPASVEQTMVRTSLLPGLLATLARNIHRELPQQIFEVGDITVLDESTDTGALEARWLAVALIGPRMSLADGRSIAGALVRELGHELVVRPEDACTSGLWIPGRATHVAITTGAGPKRVGAMGEVHPAVLERFGLRAAATLIEIDLEQVV